MTNLITVVFDEELPILKTQAQSIDLYMDNDVVDQILIVVNDQDHVASKIESTWWGKFQDRVCVIPKKNFCTQFHSHGWYSQQLLKLLAAASCYNPWSLILDAKTLFVKPITKSMLFDKDLRACVGRSLPIAPVFVPAQTKTQNLFGIELPDVLSPAGVPFFFHNNTVRDLISTVENMTNQSFAEWFTQNTDLTEFILYSGFVTYKFKNFDTLYNQITASLRCMNVAHFEINVFEEKWQEIKNNPQFTTVSVHRHAWSQLTPQQQQNYRDFLSSKGLTCEH
jgi:hypothetical protein